LTVSKVSLLEHIASLRVYALIQRYGSDAMLEHAYRAYEIGEDGHVRGRTDLLQCRNDEAAKEHAMRLVDGHAIELWDGPCRLAKFEPHRMSARPDKPIPECI
jgi:hypothetical protein